MQIGAHLNIQYSNEYKVLILSMYQKATKERLQRALMVEYMLSWVCMEPWVASPAPNRQVWQHTPTVLALGGKGRRIRSLGSSLAKRAVPGQAGIRGNLLN